MVSKKRILYIRSTSIINDSRAEKEIKCYLQNGFDVIVLCWNRQNLKNIEVAYKNKKAKVYTYTKNSKYGNGLKNIFKFISFQKWLYKNIIKLKNDFDIIHACDFDTAFIANKANKRLKKKFIYDIYDYYVDCHSLYIFKNIIEKKDINVINNADCVIICTDQRKAQIAKSSPKKVLVIHNTPEINNSLKENNIKERLKLCYVGILQDNRLLKEVAEAVKNNSNIELHVGGFGKYENYFKELANNYDNIFYYGEMKYDNVLELENKCNILFATYNPDIKNHLYSAPNKVYESMALGKAVIVCKNTGIDKLVLAEKIGYVIHYNSDEFIKVINKIKESELNKIFNKATKLYISKYSWENMKNKLIDMVNRL